MDIAIDDLPIEQNAEARRFEIRSGDNIAQLEYRLRGSSIVFTHTVVPRALEGHGIAGRLAQHGLGSRGGDGIHVLPRLSGRRR